MPFLTVGYPGNRTAGGEHAKGRKGERDLKTCRSACRALPLLIRARRRTAGMAPAARRSSRRSSMSRSRGEEVAPIDVVISAAAAPVEIPLEAHHHRLVTLGP